MNTSATGRGIWDLHNILLDCNVWDSTYYLMLLSTLLVVIRIVIYCTFILLSFTYYFAPGPQNRHSNLPPGSMGLPIIGETLTFILQGTKFFEFRYKKYGPVFKTHLFGTPVIRVMGEDNIKRILQGENDVVTSYWPASVRMMLGDKALSVSTGDDHRRRRKAIMKTFSHHSMSFYTKLMQQVVKTTLALWCEKDSILGFLECKSMAFDLAAQAFVGIRLHSAQTTELVRQYDTFVKNLFCLPFQFPGMGLVKGMAARKFLLQKIEECLVKKKESTGDDQDLQDAMSLLVREQDEEALDLDTLKEIGLELLFAGHSTTASAATSLLIHLHDNRHVVEKILEELDQFGLSESGQELNMDMLRKLTYVNAVVKEALRVAPPVGAGFRTALKSFTLNGYSIPEGWMIAYSIRETHKTDFFTDPETFEPSRWLTGDELDTKYHFLPFGGGARVCIGKEFAQMFLRIFVVELVKSCHWQIKSNRKMVMFPVPYPADNLPVVFTAKQQHKTISII
ncbi:cytochrome P450 26A1-like [Biomphalaria glabrata]|uniref:Cytochrome P450 26A1-like n=1 Tax=Biomphalaria glabrata TaxID=6526 RepID=A0A9U8EN63_BIOGL|nr:cytochrome P450 26A1-like [Biomphalaria glabrata]KAI8777685.1 cytochrome P450 26A1 [Biomphalaria glabrata]